MPQTSKLHFLKLPFEIRRHIFHQYFLSLNLPDQFFHHLTMLGYWHISGTGTAPADTRGFDLGRQIKLQIDNLFLVNQQVHAEAKAVLFSSFVLYVHPRHQLKINRDNLYNPFTKARGPQLPQQVQNIQINVLFDPIFRAWSSEVWEEAWLWLATERPQLRKVGLAIDFKDNPHMDEEHPNRELMEIVLRFARIFRSRCQVHVRFAGVDYDSYAHLSPPSLPLYAKFLEEEKLLLHLREEKKLIWHKVAKHFNDQKSEMYSVAGLQARLQRLKLRQQKAQMEVEFLQRFKEELRNDDFESGTSDSHTSASAKMEQ